MSSNNNNISVNISDAFNPDEVRPKSVILRYEEEEATLIYHDQSIGDEKRRKITRPFTDIFSVINAKVLAANTDIILPNGCVYTTRRDDGKDVFLIQELPGIRTFRLSQVVAVKELVAKMYNKFIAKTRVLEMNEVSSKEKTNVEKTIKMRNQYINQQKLFTVDDTTKKYKYFFRVYFPYTYILIVLNREVQNNKSCNQLGVRGMCAAITLDPIKSLNDYVYQFPVSNVSANGSVCTGQLSLGNFGEINTKTYVEKMTGYFWNNRFNAEITAGPELYGDKNFLGNWFEWEFISYVDPSAILTLKFDDTIKGSRRSVAQYIYDTRGTGSGSSKLKRRVHTINEHTFIEGFKTSTSLRDTMVDLENGEARKKIQGITETIALQGCDIKIGTILKGENKKFKVISFDGFRTYKIESDALKEDEIFVTHIKIKDEKSRVHIFQLTKQAKNFICDAYRKSKNFVGEAQFGSLIFKTGELIAYQEHGNFNSDVNISFDIIKNIREIEDSYTINTVKFEDVNMRFKKDSKPNTIQKVTIGFSASGERTKTISNGEEFSYRCNTIMKNTEVPAPYTVKDHLGELMTAIPTVDIIVYKKGVNPQYSYTPTEKSFFIEYNFDKPGCDTENYTHDIQKVRKKITNTDIQLIIDLPEYVNASSQNFKETYPEIEGSTTVIVGEHVYQAVTHSDAKETVPFKIMRDENGSTNLSTVRESIDVKQDSMFFLPSIDHMKSCIQEVDGVKTFRIRDLYETGSEHEYIQFQVGDEILLSSDWDPMRNNIAPSVKKIYDFISLEDDYCKGSLITQSNGLDPLLDSESGEVTQVIQRRYKKYGEILPTLENTDPVNNDYIKASRGGLYALIQGDDDMLIVHPLIDSSGQHFLNGITHVEKEIGGIKAGDFVKSKAAKIPYFAKKNVDEIVCFININERSLAVLKNGLTMWYDIIAKNFKIFKRDNLSEKKIAFYESKVRYPDMADFMILYGDQFFCQTGIPIFTKDQNINANVDEENSNRRKRLYQDTYDAKTNTCLLSKEKFDSLKQQQNGSSHFKTYTGFVDKVKALIKLDLSLQSIKALYNSNMSLGSQSGNNALHITNFKPNLKFYDINYCVNARSLTNGAAYMNMRNCFRGPLDGYSYYNRLYQIEQIHAVKKEHIKITMLTFPTPRMLKKTTRDHNSYKNYKHMGPQNRYYNFLSNSIVSSQQRTSRAVSGISQGDKLYSITSDAIFPEEEV